MVHTALALALLLAGFGAHAGYAQAVPPAGYTPATSATARATFRAAAANDAVWVGNTVRTSAALNVGGQAIKVPVAMRVAANAPAFLAKRIGASLVGGPAGLVLLGITAVQLANDPSFKQWIGNKFTYSPDNNKWTEIDDTKSVYYTQPSWWGDATIRFSSPQAVCDASGATYEAARNICLSGSYAYGIFRHDDGGSTVREVDFETTVRPQIQNNPLPVEMLPKLPLMDWPIGDPVLNPAPVPETAPVPQFVPSAQPETDPLARPQYVPVGDPVPVPNTDPQKWNQPYIEVVPSPTPSDKWRVDLRPKTVTKADATPMTDPQVDPTAPKVPLPGDPAPDPSKDPKSEDRTPGLCDLFPDILACQKLDAVKPVAVPNKNLATPLTKDSGFGTSSGASCPATRTIALKHGSTEMSYQPYCDFATGIRPVVIAIAWLTAAATFFGFVRR